MGGIEVLAGTVVFILGTAGIVRGARKEIGVTMALVVVLAVFSQFENLVPINEAPAKINSTLDGFGLGSDDLLGQQTMVWILYTAGLIVTAFLAYHGQETLAFNFKNPTGPLGVIVGWLVGALNGWLISGTSWYYLDQLNYPIRRYAWFRAEFTDLATNLVDLLPQNLVSGIILSALALGLLWWRILK